MAVNYADGIMFVSVLFYPIAAGKGAIQAGGGFLSTCILTVFGAVIGIGTILIGRSFVYLIVGSGLRCAEKIRSEALKQVFFAPFFVFYLAVPPAIIAMTFFGIKAASSWCITHL